MLFRRFQNIEKLNMVNNYNKETPNYDVRIKDIMIEFRLSPNGELIIIGRLDNNYLCWLSLTTIKDKDTNEKIFNYLANNKPYIISNEYNVLNNKYEEICYWFKGIIRKTDIANMEWETPFGYYLGKTSVEENGKHFAAGILVFFNEQIILCNYRLADRKYKDILQMYLDKLTYSNSDYCYYNEMKPVIKILEQENYLALCQDVNIRNLYLECIKAGNNLYNAYMTVVR